MRALFLSVLLLLASTIYISSALPARAEDMFYQVIDDYIKNGEYILASKLIDERMSSNSQSEALLYRKALCLYHLKNYDQSNDILRQLLAANPKQNSYYNLAGASMLQQKDYFSAIALFYDSVRQNPNDPDVWMNLSYSMRRTCYVPPNSKYLATLGKQYHDNLGYKILYAEFDLSFFRPSELQKIIADTSEDNIAEPYLRRLSLLAKQLGEITLDKGLSARIHQICKNKDDIQRSINNIDLCLDLMGKLKAARKSVIESASAQPGVQPSVDSRSLPDLPDKPISTPIEKGSPSSSGPYYLPFPYGQAKCCAQGASTEDHEGRMQYAVDFYIKPGTPICAAASGQVVSICQSNESQHHTDYGAMVIIAHQRGEYSRYFHLADNSIGVRLGQFVQRGQTIALAGCTSVSRFPILHFDVAKPTYWWNPLLPPPYCNWKSIPFKFFELASMKEESGVPAVNHWYVSQNE